MQKNIDTLANLIDTITEMKDSERKAARLRKIVPIEEWINDTYYVGPDALSIYPYWKQHIINIFNSPIRINEVILTGCFIGSTKISLLDGRDLTMKELIKEFGMEKEFWVYSVDTTTGKIVPGKAKHVRKTGVNRPVYCLELDNGEKFYCTDNHKFLKRDLTYCELKDLKIGDSLYPFITHNRYNDKYETIYDAYYHQDIATHRMVYGNVNKKNKNKVIHHINHDKHNNVPDNLVEMTRSNHNKYHMSNLTKEQLQNRVLCRKKKFNGEWYKSNESASKTGKANWDKYNFDNKYKEIRELAREKAANTIKCKWKNPDYRNKKIEEMKNNPNRTQNFGLVNNNPDMIKKQQTSKSLNWLLKNNIPTNRDNLLEELSKAKSFSKYAKIKGVRECTLWNRLRWLNLEDIAYSYGYKNHRVVSITFSHYEDVYDFEVEKYHNFALTNGVFVHNSLGTGKTTIANIIMLRKIYELSCYNNIPALFNLMASSKLLFAYFNLNMAQAELTGFGQLKEMIDNCPYFQENFPRDLKNNSMIKFTQANMSVRFASDNSHIIGSNLVAGLLDEANFYKGSDLTAESMIAQNKAARLYSDIRNRR